MMLALGAAPLIVLNLAGPEAIAAYYLAWTIAYSLYLIGFVVVALGVLCAGSWYRWWSGNPAVAVSRSEMALLVGMAVIAGIIILWLHPQAASLQAQAFAVKDEVARKAAFEAFFRIHMPVRSLYMVNLVLGILLIGIKAKRSLHRHGALT